MVHRNPMHRPLPPRIMYRNHALLHHLAFTDGQHADRTDARELGLVMMPWYTMLGLFLVASPVMVIAGVLRGPGLAGVFLLGAVAYFLCTRRCTRSITCRTRRWIALGIGRVRACSGGYRRTTATTTSWADGGA